MVLGSLGPAAGFLCCLGSGRLPTEVCLLLVGVEGLIYSRQDIQYRQALSACAYSGELLNSYKFYKKCKQA